MIVPPILALGVLLLYLLSRLQLCLLLYLLGFLLCRLLSSSHHKLQLPAYTLAFLIGRPGRPNPGKPLNPKL